MNISSTCKFCRNDNLMRITARNIDQFARRKFGRLSQWKYNFHSVVYNYIRTIVDISVYIWLCNISFVIIRFRTFENRDECSVKYLYARDNPSPPLNVRSCCVLNCISIYANSYQFTILISTMFPDIHDNRINFDIRYRLPIHT